MIGRILRSLMTLGALVVAYQAYVLLALPWLEPPINFREQQPLGAKKRASANPVTKYQRLLSHYFPAGHWSLVRPPVVISTGQMMFVMDDYQRHDDDKHDDDERDNVRLDIDRCVLLMFPTPYQEGVTPPGDAIIMEAPQGAKLQFEDFRPERVEIGQITRGEFPGKITIRSDMRSPGPEDDLLVEAADLVMNSKLLYTSSPVRFRFGPNVGGGRELEVRFLEDEHARPSKGSRIAGVASMEVRHEVRLRLYLETDSLLPGEEDDDDEADAPQSGEVVRSHAERGNEGGLRRLPATDKIAAQKPPMEVSCSGPFHFDFVHYEASFDRDVELRQINPNGPSDQLSAQQLDILFAPRADANTPAMSYATDATKRQKAAIGRLQPTTVVAQGHPVVVVSPSRAAEARGERIQIALRDQRVTIDGGQDVRLVYGPNVIRAPRIDYQHPLASAGAKLGNFRASGPGTLLYVLDPTKPDEVFTAAWETSVAMTREEGQPVITLAGRPQLSAGNMGRVTANEMSVFLKEPAGDDGAASTVSLPARGGAGSSKLAVLLERMTAVGDVQIESPQLSGRTARLEAAFQYPAAANAKSAVSAYDVAGSSDPTNQEGATERFNFGGGGSPPSQAYYLETDELQLTVAMHGQRAAPVSLACNGNVVFRELPLAPTGEQPMEVRGGQLVATNLDTAPRITIRGAGATGGASGTQLGKDAQLAARGVTVLAAVVHVDEAENRLWIDGPGTATMTVARDLAGQSTATPYPLELKWQGGLKFDGRSLVFERDVLVEAGEGWLRCDRLAAKLTAPMKFGETINQEAIDVGEIECTGHVVMDHRKRDQTGPTSHQRMQLPRLVLNQQTGALSGDGPGVLRSTHFASQMTELGARPQNSVVGPSGVEPPPGFGARPRLHFLRIDFQRGLSGNLYTRELTFQQRVRTVYGPVDAWEQELSLLESESLPADSAQLACDELRVNEDPVAARTTASANPGGGATIGPVQLTAMGNVRIEGQSTEQGTFGASADRASYDRSKERFILEGNARTPATLWQRRFPGEQPTPNEANKIEYDRLTGKVKVYGIRSFEFTPPPQPQSASGPTLRRQ